MREHFQTFYEHFRYFYLSNRFFYLIGGVILLSVAGFYTGFFFYLAILGLIAAVGATAYDAYKLYHSAKGISGSRRTPKILSLSDEMTIRVTVRNDGKEAVDAVLVDELPEQLQIRDHRIPFKLDPGQEKELSYPVRPMNRGEYGFGNINIFITSKIGLGERRLEIPQEQIVPVYPSIVQMRHFALKAKTTIPAQGMKRMRRLAKSYEFDQIKDYVLGDDFRSINWKATGRHQKLMVNQYEDERAQRVFCVIDKGRTMLMPFEGLSLLDYAINATLALSNVILARQDRAGLVTFSDKIGTVLPADSKPDHLRRLLEALYRQQERQKESNYDLFVLC